MEEEKKSPEEKRGPKDRRHPPHIVYALAEYKQLVIQSRAKQAELIKELAFWKAWTLWLGVFTVVFVIFSSVFFFDTRRQASANSNSLAVVSKRLQGFSEQVADWQRELRIAKEELARKSEQITNLEKCLSTASKKEVEKLLKTLGE